ncbi:MAG: c-type cytochrome [Steroidobacteraceae bacterium]
MKAMQLMTRSLWLGALASAAVAAEAPATQANSNLMPIMPSQYEGRPPVTPSTISAGKAIYDASCIMCHGAHGKGDGAVAFFLARQFAPRPRDFTSGTFKFRSTESGELPTDEDLFRTVTRGIPGWMPRFGGLSTAQRWEAVYYVKTFFAGFEGAKPGLIEVKGGPVPMTATSVHHGYEVYQQMRCWECHGGGGEGDGPKAPTLRDDWGFAIPPANLTRPSSFKNGHQPDEIYRMIVSGLNGTPMPSYGDLFQGHEQDAWDLVNFILSLDAEGSRE